MNVRGCGRYGGAVGRKGYVMEIRYEILKAKTKQLFFLVMQIVTLQYIRSEVWVGSALCTVHFPFLRWLLGGVGWCSSLKQATVPASQKLVLRGGGDSKSHVYIVSVLPFALSFLNLAGECLPLLKSRVIRLDPTE